MRPGEKYIYLPSHMPAVPDMTCEYRALPGKVIVRPMDCRVMNGIYYPEEQYGTRTETTVGYVLSAGAGVDLQPGDCVCYRPYDGLWCDRYTRMYGVKNDWWDQVVCKMVPGEYGPELQPLADWVLVDFEPLTVLGQECGLYYSQGSVVSLGDRVDANLLGKRVAIRKYLMYTGNVDTGPIIPEGSHQRNLDFKSGFSKPSWGLVPASEVVAVLP